MGNQPNNAFPAVLDFFPLKITYFQDMSWPRATLQCYMVDHHKEINLVNPEGNQSWIFIGRTGAETETSVLWPPDAENRLIGKDPEMGTIEGRKKQEMTEDEMVGWHHRLDGHESEQAPEVGDGQESLACCSPWGHKESDMTDQLNRWTELKSSY